MVDYAEIEKPVAKVVIGWTLVVSGATMFRALNVGGVIEWLIAFGHMFYLLAFVYDSQIATVEVGKGLRHNKDGVLGKP